MRAFTEARDARHARRDLARASTRRSTRRASPAAPSMCTTPAASRSCAPTAAARSRTTGPGQVVAYPLVDLRRLGIYVKEYVYRLEHGGAQDAGELRRHRPPRAPARRASTCGSTTRSATPRCSAGRRPAPTRSRPRQDRRARHQGQPPLHLPRRGAQRGDGPAALRAHRPVRLRRAAKRSILATLGVDTDWDEAGGATLGAHLAAPRHLDAHR